MNYIVPKKKDMKTLYNLTKRLCKRGFFEFIQRLEQRIFYINSKDESYVVIVTPDENKIDIFHGIEGFLCCHHLLSGDEKAIFQYSINNLSIESDVENLFGSSYYQENFKHYNHNGNLLEYISRKPGQNPIVVDEEGAHIIINVLEKLLIIEKQLNKKKELTKFDMEIVLVFEFVKKRKFTYTPFPLESFNFIPDMDRDCFSQYGLLEKVDLSNIIPGVLHVGLIDSFKLYEIYDDFAPFEFGLTAQIFYTLTEDGSFEHAIYSTPKEDFNRIFMAIVSFTFEKHGLYDTVITDNYMVYSALFEPLSMLGVEVKFEPNNDFNIFATNFMIKICQFESDISVIDGVINSSKDDIRDMLLNNIDNLSDFNEAFYNGFEFEEEVEEIDDDDDEEEDAGGFVS